MYRYKIEIEFTGKGEGYNVGAEALTRGVVTYVEEKGWEDVSGKLFTSTTKWTQQPIDLR